MDFFVYRGRLDLPGERDLLGAESSKRSEMRGDMSPQSRETAQSG